MKNVKNKKLFLFISFAILFIFCVVCAGITVIVQNSWLGGTSCLYDEGGFIELKNGESYTTNYGATVTCQRGRLVFNYN